MSKRTVFSTVTAIPPGISREIVLDMLHSHEDMIKLNPLVTEYHRIDPPADAPAEEKTCHWYTLVDKVQYFPGRKRSKIAYKACLHDLAQGVQTHSYAPLGMEVRTKWILGGSLPGERVIPLELGLKVPLMGLWIREDIDLKCNIIMSGIVKKAIKKTHTALIDKLIQKAKLVECVEPAGLEFVPKKPEDILLQRRESTKSDYAPTEDNLDDFETLSMVSTISSMGSSIHQNYYGQIRSESPPPLGGLSVPHHQLSDKARARLSGYPSSGASASSPDLALKAQQDQLNEASLTHQELSRDTQDISESTIFTPGGYEIIQYEIPGREIEIDGLSSRSYTEPRR